MTKTKIEWCDMTWNPVTGCLHGCDYCYARGITRRFDTYDKNPNLVVSERGKWHRVENPTAMFVIDEPIKCVQNGKAGRKEVTTPYPFGFVPTFHRYRLDEPQRVKKPQTIFVGSMADMFGEWVPDEWIKAVFEACAAAPQHRYLFLTKNPVRYEKRYSMLPSGKKYWYGSTSTTMEEPFWFSGNHNTFVSVEPIQAAFSSYFMELDNKKTDWVIIGSETGNRKNKIIPKREWIEAIVDACCDAQIPVFMKNSLAQIWGEPLIQQFPWEVTNT